MADTNNHVSFREGVRLRRMLDAYEDGVTIGYEESFYDVNDDEIWDEDYADELYDPYEDEMYLDDECHCSQCDPYHDFPEDY